ncbi:Lon protease C-terminal proteolytic domain-containing protein [Lactarius akahatsu]|uniref:Lon protease C-terminal proteolytic domain-containing protein n=1 Tax=Lactarius akahatsu TaxID=416441 RepID=A0AAD4LB65_9AGAM|nr:Lon protease C-terminal proteolytic domain-containing protein [Lactarius akahatsu]
MEYVVVVPLRALIAQEAGTEQEKAQEVTLKKVIDDPANACRALIKAGEIPALPQVPVPVPPPQSLSKVKGIKAPILLLLYVNISLTHALGQLFQRISLGGVCDEAGIRGHRPGLLSQALRKAGRMDPVLILRNDVVQSNYHGDPSAALLEVLDPEQNGAFNVPVHCTAVPSFKATHAERAFRATRPTDRASAAQNGHALHAGGGSAFTRAFDWRNRTVQAVEWAVHVNAQGLAPSSSPAPSRSASEASDALVKRSKEGGVGYSPIVEVDELEKILGLSRYDGEDREREARRGVVWGLVSIATPGSLGDMIKESAELALSWVKTHSYDLGITSKRAHDPLRTPEAMIDVHLHLPAGAQKKDGPSAGVAMVCAMVSLLTGKCVPPTTAMTSEITLRGRVSPVGGVKERVLGAHRASANKVIVPWANRKDVEHDMPKEVRARMQFVFARTVRESRL